MRKLLSSEHQGNQDRTPEAESADILLFNLAVGMTSLQKIKPRAFSLSLFLTKGKDIILPKGFLGGGLVFVFWQNFISGSALSLLGWPSSRDCHRRNGSYAGLQKHVCFNFTI